MIDRSKLDFYQRRLLDKRAALERASVLADEYKRVKSSLNKIEDLQNSVVRHITKLEQLSRIVDKEDADFRKRRITFLSEHVTNELAKIFPCEGYQATIDCDFKRGNGTASLTLIDKYGIERIPEVTEGKLCQYLISFASTVGAVKGLNTNNIFIDEAFGVSSSGNLPKIGEILKSTVDDGMQLILISQNSALYEDIPRREIHLKLDEVLDCSKVEKVIDYGGSDDSTYRV